MLRDQLQAQMTQAIVDRKFDGILMVAPRVGKSKVVIDAVINQVNKFKEWDYDFSDGFRIPVTIAIPFRTIESSWVEEFDKWFPDHQDFITLTYILHNRVHECKDKFMVVDEIQEIFNSKKKLQKFCSAKHDGVKILGLTGYMSPSSVYKAKMIGYAKPIYNYSVEKAVDDGIISDFRIILKPIKLEDQEKTVEVKEGYFVSERDNYNYITNHIDSIEDKTGNYFKGLVGKRMNYMFHYKKKLGVVKNFLNFTVGDQRALIFTARTEIADQISHSYHSKNKGEDNLEKFKRGKINRLSVCKTVSMGVTIPNLKIGIFHQLDSNAEKHLQKVLRLCNLEDSSHKAMIYIFYYEGTRDEDWATQACAGIPERFIVR